MSTPHASSTCAQPLQPVKTRGHTMSMMLNAAPAPAIAIAIAIAPGAVSTGQPKALSEAPESDGSPSFFEVLAKSLLPDTVAPGKNMTKAVAPARHQDKQTSDDKVDPTALLMGINLPIFRPEPKSVHVTPVGEASALKVNPNALTRSKALLPAVAAASPALLAASSTAQEVPALGAPLAEPLPAATHASPNDVLTGEAMGLAALAAKALPANTQPKEALAEMVTVRGDPGSNLPVSPAAASELTAAVQTLTHNLRRTTTETGQVKETGQANAPAAKNAIPMGQSDPIATLVPTITAETAPFNSAARGEQPLESDTFLKAGLNTKPDQPSLGADKDAARLESASAKSDAQFITTLTAATAVDQSAVAVPNAVGAMVPASPEPAWASNATAIQTRAFLAPEVGSQGWDKALSQQMLNLGKAGHQITELQLNPPGLGPLKVTLDLNDHQMQLTFVSSHASVRAAVEAAVPQLRATLADSGINLGNASVNAESQPQTQSAFSQGQGRAPDHRAYPSRSLPDNSAPLAQAAAVASPQGGGLAVDTYA
ncbi:MAG: hypothetical protein CO105_08405 [Comamonadaceae bacterium CG_4_9_14_3_um_filter_60_33]|nr:MAG: hypothetical protein COZ09_02940 [Comamonadaceae bacterium CG_4_10_14_3_um_filter_60_42]PJB43647.1 MAG: hypothetical protein CO105_08405 [Comamonadaceae bacterium CG_4_9_14_3_um_filter_60_33]